METWDTPLTDTLHGIRKVALETSAKLGKNIELCFTGEETKVPKSILQDLSSPLLHLIRNAIDHGIETPNERAKLGKAREGKVALSVTENAENWVIEVRDDGAGINPDHVELIFKPGFSTKSEITEISGRGIGLDVVKANIEKLGGEVQLITRLQHGTTFRILIPRSDRSRS